MGHKVNPKIFRLGRSMDWSSKWFYNYHKKSNIQKLKEDILIRQYLEKELKGASIDKIQVERSFEVIKIIIHTARPGFIIGRSGQTIEKLKKDLKNKFVFDKKSKFDLVIKEVKDPNLSAQIILESIALNLEKRIPYRRILKKHIDQVKKAGAQGVKIVVSGRLGGVEIARQETMAEGKIPLHTIRADIDYAQSAAHTIYGAIGIKVWVYKGDVFDNDLNKEENKETQLTKQLSNKVTK